MRGYGIRKAKNDARVEWRSATTAARRSTRTGRAEAEKALCAPNGPTRRGGGRASLGEDNSGYPWNDTQAHLIFEASEPDPSGSGKRYATARGIAFAAVETNDGTWHGYPEPWNRVPPDLVRRWLTEKKVKRSSLKHYKDFPDDNIRWALDSDDE